MRVARRLLAGGLIVAGLAFASSAQASCYPAVNYAMWTSLNTAVWISTQYGPAGHSHTLSYVQNEGCTPRSPQDAYWSWIDRDNSTGVYRTIYMQAWVYGSPGAFNEGPIHWIRYGPDPGHARLNSGLVDTPGF